MSTHSSLEKPLNGLALYKEPVLCPRLFPSQCIKRLMKIHGLYQSGCLKLTLSKETTSLSPNSGHEPLHPRCPSTDLILAHLVPGNHLLEITN